MNIQQWVLLLGCIALASAAPSKVEDSETLLEGDDSKQRSVEDGSLTSEASESRFLLDPSVTTIQRKSDAPCPPDFEDWNQDSEYCYVKGNKLVQLHEAQKECKKLEAKVVRIHDEQDMTRITNIMRVPAYWIDLGRPQDPFGNTGPFRWFNSNEEPTQTFWAPDHPSGSGNCVGNFGKHWKVISCADRVDYACMKKRIVQVVNSDEEEEATTITDSTSVTSDSTSCDCAEGYEDWVEGSEYCYKFPATPVLGNFWQSEAVCKYEHDGGKLIVVDTPEINDVVAQKLEEIGPDASCVIDLQATIVWTRWHDTQRSVRYQPWEPKQPSVHDEGRCAFIYGNGLWKMLPCTQPSIAPCMKKKDCGSP